MVKTQRDVIIEKYEIIRKDLEVYVKNLDILPPITPDLDISNMIMKVLYFFEGDDDYRTIKKLLKLHNINLDDKGTCDVYNIIVPFVDYLRRLRL